MALAVKNPPAMQENRVQSLGQEELLEEGSDYLLQYCCLEEPGRSQIMGLQELDKTEQLSTVLGKPHRVQLSYSFQTS